MSVKYSIGLIIFSIVSALVAVLSAKYAFVGGAIMGLCYAAIYSLGYHEGKNQ